MFLNALLLMFAATGKPIRLEAEDGQRTGVTVATRRAGYSGTGYVTGFEHEGDRVEWKVAAQAGLYTVKIHYSAPHGEKGYALVVNGATYLNRFVGTGDAFGTADAGKVELKNGRNAVSIEKGWGYYDIDYVELAPVTALPALHAPPKRLADSRATRRTRDLMGALIDLYGSRTLSGQIDPAEADYIYQITGKRPAIVGGDLIDYSPSRVAHAGMPKEGVETLIPLARAGAIVTLLWHWNAPSKLIDGATHDAQGKAIEAPWYKGFYTYATTFDLQQALDHPESPEYGQILRDIDAIAVPLKRLADVNVPVLWRPLHEAEGRWFWWGAHGPRPFVKLWRLLFDRLTNHHHLHNLIWVFTGSANADWYPGDAYVDIVGTDAYPPYPGDPLSGIWEELQRRFDGHKLLALTEFGGVPDVAKMRRFGVRWSYFASWSGDLGPRKRKPQELKRIYTDPTVVNFDQILLP